MIKYIKEISKDLVRHVHNKVVGSIGIVSIILGIIANLKQYGYLAALIFLLTSLIALYVLMSEISCVISGKCYITAILNATIAFIIFGGIIVYYSKYLFGNSDLPDISKQPIVKVDRAVIPVAGIVQAEVTKVIKNRNMDTIE